MRTAEVKILEMGYTLECLAQIPELSVNDRVLVEKDKIIYLGTVSGETKVFADDALPARPSSSIIRKLFPFETGEKYIHYPIENEGLDFCKKNAEDLKLIMKLLRVKYMPSENKLVFYYSAEERVDFRELVKILASRFHLRIEMRQINIRDECKILGGIGICGRVCCCTAVVPEMNAVTSKITKLQCQNTSKFVGYCGRLLCCLAFDPPVPGEDICKDKKDSGAAFYKGDADSYNIISGDKNTDISKDIKIYKEEIGKEIKTGEETETGGAVFTDNGYEK
jgi:cell fate regulator YaaT (PSP1 superfamily)